MQIWNNCNIELFFYNFYKIISYMSIMKFLLILTKRSSINPWFVFVLFFSVDCRLLIRRRMARQFRRLPPLAGHRKSERVLHLSTSHQVLYSYFTHLSISDAKFISHAFFHGWWDSVPATSTSFFSFF